MMIPKIIHIIWVGDAAKRPDNCIATWRQHHPAWQVKIWGNDELRSGIGGRAWENKRHMATMEAERSFDSVADMMRYEILLAEGGVYVDADSVCLQPLPDWLLTCDVFASWENELALPGLIANSFLGFQAGDALLRRVIDDIKAKPDIAGQPPYKATGPGVLTQAWQELRYSQLTVVPSHFFNPRHHSGAVYAGHGPVYAAHFSAGTRFTSLFDRLYKQDVSDWQKVFPHIAPEDFKASFDGFFSDNDLLATFNALTAMVSQQGRAVKFLQIGAMNGHDFDPINIFIMQHGWQGLLVEPMPHHFAALHETYAGRSGLVFENAAITEADGPVDIYYVPPDVLQAKGMDHSVAGMPSLLRERNLHDRPDAHVIKSLQQTMTVNGLSLPSLLTKHGITDLDIYVSDTEGMDWDILRQLDLTTLAPRIVYVEFNHMLPGQMAEFAAHMHAHGYKIYLREYSKADALCIRGAA
jgi:FkbM family methyltransferase